MQINENDILSIISSNPEISQRKIAEKTGISLGKVNFLIKKCVKKGWMKIEQLNSRTVQYILTPKGVQEKTNLTLSYIRKSYKAIMSISNSIKNITQDQIGNNKTIIIYGEKGELRELVELTLKEMKAKYIATDHISKINDLENVVIYMWDPCSEDELQGYNYINILNCNTLEKI